MKDLMVNGDGLRECMELLTSIQMLNILYTSIKYLLLVY